MYLDATQTAFDEAKAILDKAKEDFETAKESGNEDDIMANEMNHDQEVAEFKAARKALW